MDQIFAQIERESKPIFRVLAAFFIKKRIYFILIFILFFQFGFLFVSQYTYAATHDLATDSNWDIRIDGEQAGDKLGRYNISYGDINYDGVDDLILTVKSPLGYSGRTGINITYVIYSTLLDTFKDTKIIDLNNSADYNLKIVAAESGDLSDYYVASAVDLNNNGKKDLVLGQGYANNGAMADTGAVYIIYDSILDNYTGTGNLVDLSDTNTYNVKFVGTATGDYLGYSYNAKFDFNGDGKKDLLLNADTASSTNGGASGSAYVIYNDLLATFTGVGTVVDLSNSANYNIRIDGPTAGTWTETYIVGDHSDVNNDGVDDVIVYVPYASNNGLTYSGSAYVIYSTIIDTYTGTGNVLNLADPTKYNLRFDGPRDNSDSGTASFGYSVTQVADLNNNGKNDIILVDSYLDNNGRAGSGSAFSIYDSLLETYTGTGNNISLTSPNNYTARYDGDIAGSIFGEDTHALDMNNDGKLDLIMDAAGSSAVYILDNSLLTPFTTTGNLVDMASSSNYTTLYTHSGGYLSGPANAADLNGDGKIDFVLADAYNDYNGRSDSGSVYIIYNFPHVITPSASTVIRNTLPIVLAGNITSTSSATTISAVQYNIDSNVFSDSGWSSCSADDGDFDSNQEAYTCAIHSISIGSHTVYIRAQDSDGSYTSQGSYVPISVNYSSTITDSAPYYTLERISVASTTPLVEGNGYSGDRGISGISGDGRFVVFDSAATNLVPNDTNGVHDVFLYDSILKTIRRISISDLGVEGNGESYHASISADGHFVVFASYASNLVPGDSNGTRDIFLYDTTLNTIRLISKNDTGDEGNGESFHTYISGDGHFIVFNSAASNLVDGDTNGKNDLFLFDTTLNTVRRITVNGSGVEESAGLFNFSISSDGKYIAFSSDASNLVENDTNNTYDVFFYDTTLNTIKQISVDDLGVKGDGESTYPSITADGKFVTFESAATNLVPNDTNGTYDIFLYDTTLNTIKRISVDGSGIEGNSYSTGSSISANGKFIVYNSDASNLVPNDNNGTYDIFRYNVESRANTLVSVASNGEQANWNETDYGGSYMVGNRNISDDGNKIIFTSYSTNLVPNDTNSSADVFLVTMNNAIHDITASTGYHGSISPIGTIAVNDGSNQLFTITPDVNYHIADVSVDGISVGVVTTYNFTNVTAAHTISATFAVTSSGGGGGSSGGYVNPAIPISGFKITINQGVSTTTNRLVNLNFNVGSDIKKMAISLTGDFKDVSQENYSPNKQIDLCSKSGGLIKNPTCPDGHYTIYVKFFNQYGRASDVVSTKVSLSSNLPKQNSTSGIFTKTLSIGMTLGDVRRLQTLLATKPEIYPEGLTTGYFGQLTKKAVQKFQLKYSVVKSKLDSGYGLVGPKTRVKLQEVFGN